MCPRVRDALLDPRGALNYLTRKWTIKRLSGSSFREIYRYYSDLQSNRDMHAYLRKWLPLARGVITRTAELYVLVRAFLPNTVIETGVSSGFSSTFILQALEDNGRGFLYSIDAPNVDPSSTLPKGFASGWLVPASLRGRWNLILGRSFEALPALLDKVKTVDLFLHDSEHTYENMTFEFRAAWKYLRKGGMLLSHDVFWNNAFSDFCKSVGRRPSYIVDTGLLQK